MDISMVLASEPLASMTFLPTMTLIGALKTLGNPLYENRSDPSMARLIADAVPFASVQLRRPEGRFKGYHAADLRSLDPRLLSAGRQQCCVPGSPAYKYRHRMVTYFRGSPRGSTCARCDSRADAWATIRGSCPGHDPRDGYLALCSRCHSLYDHEGER